MEVSIHPPRVGRDGLPNSGKRLSSSFNPPSPCGEGQALHFQPVWLRCGFNPPSPCGEGLTVAVPLTKVEVFQSTLPVWGGTSPRGQQAPVVVVSIHPPRVGRDPSVKSALMGILGFQSTLPVWGGTPPPPPSLRQFPSFNPPSPCGEGLASRQRRHSSTCVSIHPPRVGRDCW